MPTSCSWPHLLHSRRLALGTSSLVTYCGLPNLRFQRFSIVRRLRGTAHSIPSPIRSRNVRTRRPAADGDDATVVVEGRSAMHKAPGRISVWRLCAVVYEYQYNVWLRVPGGNFPPNSIGKACSMRCTNTFSWARSFEDIFRDDGGQTTVDWKRITYASLQLWCGLY